MTTISRVPRSSNPITREFRGELFTAYKNKGCSLKLMLKLILYFACTKEVHRVQMKAAGRHTEAGANAHCLVEEVSEKEIVLVLNQSVKETRKTSQNVICTLVTVRLRLKQYSSIWCNTFY